MYLIFIFFYFNNLVNFTKSFIEFEIATTSKKIKKDFFDITTTNLCFDNNIITTKIRIAKDFWTKIVVEFEKSTKGFWTKTVVKFEKPSTTTKIKIKKSFRKITAKIKLVLIILLIIVFSILWTIKKNLLKINDKLFLLKQKNKKN